MNNPKEESGVGFKITEIFAFLADHGDGDEGVIAASINGLPVPLIAADSKRMEQYKELALSECKLHNISCKLVKFSVREELEVVHEEVDMQIKYPRMHNGSTDNGKPVNGTYSQTGGPCTKCGSTNTLETVSAYSCRSCGYVFVDYWIGATHVKEQ